jgi:hypothetical protein
LSYTNTIHQYANMVADPGYEINVNALLCDLL